MKIIKNMSIQLFLAYLMLLLSVGSVICSAILVHERHRIENEQTPNQ